MDKVKNNKEYDDCTYETPYKDLKKCYECALYKGDFPFVKDGCKYTQNFRDHLTPENMTIADRYFIHLYEKYSDEDVIKE